MNYNADALTAMPLADAKAAIELLRKALTTAKARKAAAADIAEMESTIALLERKVAEAKSVQ